MRLAALIFFFIFIPNKVLSEKSANVLMYHRFNDDRYTSTNISIENFKNQMEYLHDNQFNVLPLSKLIEYFYSNFELPDKSVFITIDDGFKSFYNFGFEVLRKYNFPFSIFISSSFVSKDINSDFMSWEMLKEISENNGSIYNHSHSHRSMIDLSSKELLEEINESEKIIKKKIGVHQKIFSYPYGISDEKIQKILEEKKYKIAFAQYSSPINKKQNKFKLPRFSINDDYGSMKRFKTVVNSLNLNIFDIKPTKLETKEANLQIEFKTTHPISEINCYANKNIKIFETKKNNKISIDLSGFKKKGTYSFNCTRINNGKVYWFGDSITKK